MLKRRKHGVSFLSSLDYCSVDESRCNKLSDKTINVVNNCIQTDFTHAVHLLYTLTFTNKKIGDRSMLRSNNFKKNYRHSENNEQEKKSTYIVT